MILFLPINRYLVRYEVASGRPYSKFERFLLEAVQQKVSSIEDLVTLTRIHRRVVVEGLVSLMHAGWVAVRTDADETRFVTTPSGREALGDKYSLPPDLAIEQRTMPCLMERVAGQLARSSDYYLLSKRKLQERNGGKPSLMEMGLLLPNLYDGSTPEPGRVRPLLRVNTQESQYVRRILDVDLDDAGNFYRPVDVNVAEGTINGLPEEWEALLHGELLDRARRHEAELRRKGERADDGELRGELARAQARDAQRRDDEGEPPWLVNFDPDDLIVGRAAHRDTLHECLRRARSTVVIATGGLAPERIQALAPHIMAALRRGVRVDILWGGSVDAPPGSAPGNRPRIIEELEREALPTGGRLMTTPRATGSNARVLLSDPDGRFEALIGSFDWLSAGPQVETLDISVRVRHPAALARLCLFLGDLFVSDDRLVTSANATGLKNVGSDLEKKWALEGVPSAPGSSAARLRLITDHTHTTEFNIAVSEARESVCVAIANWVDPAGSSPHYRALLAAAERGCKQVEVLHGLGPSIPGEVYQDLVKRGVRIRSSERCRVNLLTCDDGYALLTGFGWFGRPDGPRRPSGFDLGVVLEGGQVGRWLSEVVKPYMAPS